MTFLRTSLLTLLLTFTALLPAAAQESGPSPIRAWYGPTLMFTTDLSKGVGVSIDGRVTIERPGVAGVSVILGQHAGLDESNATSNTLYGAFLGGRSFPVAEDVFLHVSAGLGYARYEQFSDRIACDQFGNCNDNTERTIGAILPVRAELHVPLRRDRTFGIVAQAIPYGDVSQRLSVGLHLSFGRNLAGSR